MKEEASIELDDEKSIKDQLEESIDKLKLLEPVVSIIINDFETKSIEDFLNMAISEFNSIGNAIYRLGFGKIIVDEKRLRNSRRYIKDKNEATAYLTISKVLKRGIVIYDHLNHKGRNYQTITIAGPVIINNLRGNVAVVVKRTNEYYYHVHRIVASDGLIFRIKK